MYEARLRKSPDISFLSNCQLPAALWGEGEARALRIEVLDRAQEALVDEAIVVGIASG